MAEIFRRVHQRLLRLRPSGDQQHNSHAGHDMDDCGCLASQGLEFVSAAIASRTPESAASATSPSSAVCSVVVPFREPAWPPSNSIQPALKPSSILMRGAGYFIPCDLNKASQVSRVTACIR